jgi:2-polyprenyl-3-methyl-5-hydroxy-6-metoxy-1,4-benzoquinol methylase
MKQFIVKLLYQIMYLLDPPWDTNRTPPEVYEFLATNSPGRALDLGCGTGTNVISLAKHGWKVTGIDFIAKAIRTAKRKAAKEGVTADFLTGDVTKLDGIQEQFDFILDMGCYHSLDQPGMQAYQNNINLLLKPGGTFLLYLFFRSNDGYSGSAVQEADLVPFLDFLELLKRQDGTERGIHKSSWLTYRKSL